jgi:hypothetical protein
MCLANLLATATSRADSIANDSCIPTPSAGTLSGLRGVVVNGECVVAGDVGSDGTPAPVTKTVNCGTPAHQIDVDPWNYAQCGAVPKMCSQPAAQNKVAVVPAFATLQQDPRTSAWTLIDVWCPANAVPAPDAQAVRAQIIRLLPVVGLRAVPPGGQTLVNFETIMWADTVPTRSLGKVRILGQGVDLQIQFESAEWDFGDHKTDTTSTPGKPYSAEDPCSGRTCPQYFGHLYQHRGPVTVAMTPTWTASYSLDGSHWLDLAEPITGPTSTMALLVRESHGVLVAPTGP